MTYLFCRFLTNFPQYKAKMPSKKEYADDEEMRKCSDFEEFCTNMYAIFDGVIANLEEVDKALQEVQYTTPLTHFSRKMVQVIAIIIRAES